MILRQDSKDQRSGACGQVVEEAGRQGPKEDGEDGG